MDEEGCTVLGGRAETIAEGLGTRFQPGMGADAAIRLCVELLAGPEGSLGPDQLEVAILDRARARRAFRRIEGPELSAILAGCATRLPVAEEQREHGAEHRDDHERERDHPRPARALTGLDAGIPPLARRRHRRVDLSGEEHVASVVELLLGHVDVDPRHVADGEAVDAVERPGQAGVDAARLEPRLQHASAEGTVDRCDLGQPPRCHPVIVEPATVTLRRRSREGPRMGRVSRRLGIVMTVLIASAGLMMLSAPVAEAKTVDTGKWAKGFCQAVEEWQTSVTKAHSLVGAAVAKQAAARHR